jgi:hypothetical protein
LIISGIALVATKLAYLQLHRFLDLRKTMNFLKFLQRINRQIIIAYKPRAKRNVEEQ